MLLLAARLSGAAAGFLVQLILARFLSAHDLGIYYAATSLAVIGGVIAAHGYPIISTRFVSRYRRPSGTPLLRIFVRNAQRETLILAFVTTALVSAGTLLWPGIDTATRLVILLSVVTIPFVAAFRLYGSLALATRAFALAYLPDTSFKPMVVLVALALILLSLGHISLTLAMICLAAATVGLSIGQCVLLARRFPVSLFAGLGQVGARTAATKSIGSRWRREAVAVLLVAVFSQFFQDLTIIIATPILGPADVGVFGLCLKLAFLIGFFVILTQTLAMPDLADALAKRSERTRSVAHALSGSAAAIATVAAALFCLLWGDRFLGVFGADFAVGKTALVILVVAQLVPAVFGPTSAVLTLVGEQRINLILVALATLILVASVALGGLVFGIEGAAWAVLLTYLFWSASSACVLKRKHGIRVDLFAQHFGRANPGPALAAG